MQHSGFLSLSLSQGSLLQFNQFAYRHEITSHSLSSGLVQKFTTTLAFIYFNMNISAIHFPLDCVSYIDFFPFHQFIFFLSEGILYSLVFSSLCHWLRICCHSQICLLLFSFQFQFTHLYQKGCLEYNFIFYITNHNCLCVNILSTHDSVLSILEKHVRFSVWEWCILDETMFNTKPDHLVH